LAFHSGREADHSPSSSAEVKEWEELYLNSPSTPSWRGAQVGGTQGQLYLYILYRNILQIKVVDLCNFYILHYVIFVRLVVLEKILQVGVFWVVTPCDAVVGYQRFGETYCLHLQDENLDLKSS
jgi:hypothetical protein